MTDSPTIATYRWSSDRSEDRFTVENPATGQTITVVQGGGAPEIDAAVQAAHRAFGDNWRWRSPAERAGLLLRGAEVLAWSVHDYENFLALRPELTRQAISELTEVTRVVASRQWPIRVHATYDETISQILDVFQQVFTETGYTSRWAIDHAETITQATRFAAAGYRPVPGRFGAFEQTWSKHRTVRVRRGPWLSITCPSRDGS